MRKLGLAALSAFILFLLYSCALYQGQGQHHSSSNPTTTQLSSPPTTSPSPLNTSANPWTNVNPQVQGQIAKQRPPR